ncbi:hypothetical protein [Aliarcobacter butzleri]|uniref:hypothetical protein n=1 Tax=Aliarcobacter butzleri TaxID=28197 RepID=UPI00125F66EB|nr:hypothetical protein [Aliarcobacter butzleri]
MSTVLFWAAFDQSKFSSAYVVSESRFTMKDNYGRNIYWDHGKKIFVVDNKYIFAYCGNVLYPITILSKLKEFIENKLLDFDHKSFENKIKLIREYILPSYKKYPIKESFSILFLSVNNKKINLSQLDFKNNNCDTKIFDIREPVKVEYNGLTGLKETLFSPFTLVIGSGSSYYIPLEKSFNKKGAVYSRDKFKCLYKMVNDQLDEFSYGPLQIARIYTDGVAKPIGFIDNEKKFLYGEEINDDILNDEFEWRNKNFEVCNSKTLKLKLGSQAQP